MLHYKHAHALLTCFHCSDPFSLIDYSWLSQVWLIFCHHQMTILFFFAFFSTHLRLGSSLHFLYQWCNLHLNSHSRVHLWTFVCAWLLIGHTKQTPLFFPVDIFRMLWCKGLSAATAVPRNQTAEWRSQSMLLQSLIMSFDHRSWSQFMFPAQGQTFTDLFQKSFFSFLLLVSEEQPLTAHMKTLLAAVWSCFRYCRVTTLYH